MMKRRPDDPMPPPWHDPTGFAWMVYCRDVLGDQRATRRREYLRAARRALGLLRQPKKVLVEDVESVYQISEGEAGSWRAGGARIGVSSSIVTATLAKPWYVRRDVHHHGGMKNLRWWTLSASAARFYDSRREKRKEWPLADNVLSSPLDFAGMTNPQDSLFNLCVDFITSVSDAVGGLRLMKSGDISEWVSTGAGTKISVPVDWDEEVAYSGRELWGGWRERLLCRRVTTV